MNGTPKRVPAWLTIIVVWILGLAAPAIQAQSTCSFLGEEHAVLNMAGRTFLQSGDSLIEVETVTDACLSCHDGTIGVSLEAPPAEHEPGLGGFLFADRQLYETAGTNHPFDVPYPTGDREYVPMNDLDPRLELHDGLVTCRTCHKDESATNSPPPFSQRGFCVACHLK